MTANQIINAIDAMMKKWDDIPNDLMTPAEFAQQMREYRPMPVAVETLALWREREYAIAPKAKPAPTPRRFKKRKGKA